MSSPHQQLKDAKNEGERTHPVSFKVKSNLQIFPFCERVGGCWDMLWKKKKKDLYQIPSSKPCTRLSVLWISLPQRRSAGKNIV